MKVLLVQSNPTVGALEANAAALEGAIRRAEELQAEAVLFPELALTGYPPRDLVLDPSFVAANLALARRVAGAARRTTAVFGFVDPEPGGGLHNAAAVARNGVIEAVARKLLLPTYDVFDERRYFQPGTDPLLVDLGGRRVGVLICEDVWNDAAYWGRALYPREPVAELARRGMDTLLVVSASPFSTGRVTRRVEMMAAHARRHRIRCAYLNQVGGNDSLVFDGASFALDAGGGLLDMARPFREDERLVDLDAQGKRAPPRASDARWAYEALVLGLRDYARKCGFTGVVLGLSGGIDSALTASLAVAALGAGQVVSVFMPSRFSSPESREDARAVAGALGIRLLEIPIDRAFEAFREALEEPFRDTPFGIAEENLQARIRGTLLMALSNKFGWLVLSTGNKSELAVGYCTLYGDMSGGLAVISDLPKGMVYDVARVANQERHAIPERVFTKAPTAELRENQRDEDSLPPYPQLDAILKAYVEDGRSLKDLLASGLDEALVRRVTDLVDRNEYKRSQAAPGLRVTSKAFGVGRRMPIARHYPRPPDRDGPGRGRRIGVFGGSFNPPHRGHEDLVETLLGRELVDELWVVPVYAHPFGKELAPFADRLAMCRLGFSRFGARLEVSGVEAELGAPSYTVRTLERLRATLPPCRLLLVVGADTLKDSDKWRDFERVKRLAALLVVPRQGEPAEEALAIPAPRAVSSTAIRARLARGEPAGEWLHPEVEAYILAHGLYGATVTAGREEGGP